MSVIDKSAYNLDTDKGVGVPRTAGRSHEMGIEKIGHLAAGMAAVMIPHPVFGVAGVVAAGASFKCPADGGMVHIFEGGMRGKSQSKERLSDF